MPILRPSLLRLTALALVGVPALASAQPTVAPGEGRTFPTPDDGFVECRRGESGEIVDACLGARFMGTLVQPGAGEARTRIFTVGPVAPDGNPSYATAGLYKDVVIDGAPSDNFVPVQFSATFNFRTSYLMFGAYTVGAEVSLRVQDIGTGRDVTTAKLIGSSRDADQGLTEAAAGNDRTNIEAVNGSTTVLLRRGREYRVFLQLESVGQGLLDSGFEVDAILEWTSLVVRVDEDEVEQLADHDAAISAGIATHDAAVRADLATHDAAIGAQVAAHDAAIRAQVEAHDVAISSQVDQHDMDIKALLGQLQNGQDEIIRLLLTPQGRRETDFGACADDGCDFPQGTGNGGGAAPDDPPATPPVAEPPAPPAAPVAPAAPARTGGGRSFWWAR